MFILDSITNYDISGCINEFFAALAILGGRIGQFGHIERCRLVNIVDVFMLGDDISIIGNSLKRHDRLPKQC